jgi:hypothetical protein
MYLTNAGLFFTISLEENYLFLTAYFFGIMSYVKTYVRLVLKLLPGSVAFNQGSAAAN